MRLNKDRIKEIIKTLRWSAKNNLTVSFKEDKEFIDNIIVSQTNTNLIVNSLFLFNSKRNKT